MLEETQRGGEKETGTDFPRGENREHIEGCEGAAFRRSGSYRLCCCQAPQSNTTCGELEQLKVPAIPYQ